MSTYLINHLRIPGGVPKEGGWLGSAVLIEFPDMAKGKEWYNSPEYQQIPSLRTDHTISDLILVEGVGPDFTPAGYAQQIRGAIAAATDKGS
ncbi:DUF1330 domain-containing protein [Streptomyces sp. NPDC051219]|uniref:DUF1330 domain-containing protein n=1 Tax=Streptomyces sp. NPDC051219 TaxID=3155283 RepID=UPI0034481C3B